MWLRWCCSYLIQIRMWCLCPYLKGCSPIPPPLPHTGSGTGAKGPGRELISSSLSMLLFREPNGPSLTLASAPLMREHRGPPIPVRHWLPCWSRSTGARDDAAAQRRELGPQLGARCLCSPTTCRPVRDTVCASFCREYLNTCGERPRTHPERSTQDPVCYCCSWCLLLLLCVRTAPPPAPPACPAEPGGAGEAQLVHQSGQLQLFQLC